MDKSDKTRACYQHASLRYIQRDNMTNTSLRERFDIDKKNISMVSKIINETLKEKKSLSMMRVLEAKQENIYHGGQNDFKFVSPLFH